MAALTPAEIKRVKGMGFLKNRTTEGFSMRIVTKNGVLTAEQLATLSDVAKRWGNGKISLTSRMTIELPDISYEDIPTVQEYVAKNGLISGGTGPRVRQVVACKGTVCQFGNCDTQDLAERLHDYFFNGYKNVILPDKFKIAVGGCPNNCVKPGTNDFGIVAVKTPNYQEDTCVGCKKCQIEAVCPMGAAKLEHGKMILDKELCINCGRCVGKCPFKAIPNGEQRFAAFVGGRWGKVIRHASRVPGLFTEEELFKLIEKTILLYREQGYSGERLAVMVDRMGEEKIFHALLHDDILARKERIIAES